MNKPLILVVEDDKPIRNLITLTLESQQYRLVAVETGGAAVLASLSQRPDIMILDEPTRGLDPLLRNRLGDLLLRHARGKGATVIVVTQDMEFAASWAERVVLLFNGEVIAAGTPREIFRGEPFYSSQVSRMFRGFAEGVVTIGDAREAMGMRGGTDV